MGSCLYRMAPIYRHAPDGAIVYGTYKGVRVGVIRTNGKIATVFPDSNQTPALNRRRRKK